MEYQININTVDILKVILYGHNRNKFNWVLFISVSIIGLWTVGFLLDEIFTAFLIFLIQILLFYFFTFIFTVLFFLLNPKWRKGRLGKHLIEISDKGMVETTEYNRSEIYWRSINKIQLKSDGLYLVYSGTEFFLIPKRCFDSIESFNEFVEKIFTKWHEGNNA
jgi:hypothetical protein